MFRSVVLATWVLCWYSPMHLRPSGLWLSTLESFKKFIDTRGNQIQLTEPAFVKVRECQETINQLFEQLVGGKAKLHKR